MDPAGLFVDPACYCGGQAVMVERGRITGCWDRVLVLYFNILCWDTGFIVLYLYILCWDTDFSVVFIYFVTAFNGYCTYVGFCRLVPMFVF